MNKSTSTAYIDSLTNLLIIFFLLFVLQQMRVMQEQFKKQAIEQKAEIVIELEWPDTSTTDIDLHLLLPDARTVNYTAKDAGLAVLERDDRGAWGDYYYGADGKPVVILSNKEVITIRGILPGKYVVNAHYFSHINMQSIGMDEPLPEFVELTAKVTDLNPTFREAGSVKKKIHTPGEQITLLMFEVDNEGSVKNVDTVSDLPFIQLGAK